MDIVLGDFAFHGEGSAMVVLLGIPLILAMQLPGILRGVRKLVLLIKRKGGRTKNDLAARLKEIEKG